jgi:hypothetical protein
MDLVNATKMQAGDTTATRPDGRELLVVVVKGTFTIPKPGEEVALAETQLPLIETDAFTGEPGFSAPLYEIDFAPRKPHCDVLLNGSAHAPGGKPTGRVKVSLRVGSWTKSFEVVGNRRWKAGMFHTGSTNPEPFDVMPISYNNAFGGVDRSRDDELKHRYFLQNHVGVGYHEYLDEESLEGQPLPNTEETGKPVTKPDGDYQPMAFGPIGRAWKQRIQYGGTYGQHWIDNEFPFLPADFDERYFQCAAEDQQIDYLRGGEEVVLINLDPRGLTEFKLPALKEPFDFFFKNGERKRIAGVVDTLMLEPDLGRFTLSLRASLPLRRNLHEVSSIAVGRVVLQAPSADGEEREMLAKPHYKSLADLAAANRARQQQ